MNSVPWLVWRRFRAIVLVLLFFSSAARCSRPEDVASHRALRPNVRGADIRVLSDSGEHDPAPVVLPAAPLHLVIDDCRDFALFQVPDTFTDPESGIVILNWTEPLDRQRSLTILVRSASCASHDGVKRLLRSEPEHHSAPQN